MERRAITGARRLLALLMCAAMLCTAAPAWAEGAEAPEGVFDPAALTDMVEGFLREQGIPFDRVGIGFCCPATGEEWFYNPDTWFYPASMYKVPLMMVLAEQVHDGTVAEDTQIGGLPLQTVFEYILINSNNDYAHLVRKFLSGDEVWRENAKQYAQLNEYDPRYMEYCYFSPRFMTQVLETLYDDSERFPRVIDCMLRAEQAHYFRLADDMHQLDVAQKYGSYSDMEGTDWNHNAGIIYTPRPIILTVMTKNVPNYEWVIGHFALLFTEYALSLDEKLSFYEQEKAALEAAQAAELARLEAEQAEAERLEAERVVREREEAQRRAVEAREKQEKASRHLLISLAVTAAGLVLLPVLSAVLVALHKKKKRYEQYRRRFEEELRQENLDRQRAAGRERRRS